MTVPAPPRAMKQSWPLSRPLFAGLCSAALFPVAIPAASAQVVARYGRSDAAQSVWRIDRQPLLTIEGAAEAFSRVTGAVRLDDGRIVVADRDTRKVHYFDRRGGYQRSVGGPGRGPGEVRDIDFFAQHRGKLVLYDGNLAVHLLDAASGQFLRRLALPRMEGYITTPAVGILPDETILFAARTIEAPRKTPGGFLDSLGLFLSGKEARFLSWFRTGERNLAEGSRASDAKGYSPRARHTVLNNWVCSGYTARYEIKCATLQGATMLTIARSVLSRPVTSRDRDAYRRAAAGYRRDGSNRFRDASLREYRARTAERTAFMATHPVWFDFMASRSGELWVREYSSADAARPGYLTFPESASSWSVFNAAGKWLASVSLPERFVPTEIGDDYVLGVAQDEDEVERAVMYRLERSG